MRVVLLVVVCALLAGCVDEPPPGVPADPDIAQDLPDGPVAAENGDEAPSAVMVPPQQIDVEWSGNLGTFAYACEYQTTGACQGQIVTEDDASLFVPAPGSVLETVSLAASWTPTGPLHGSLTFVVMAIGGCNTCNDTHIASAEGGPGVAVQVDGLDIPLGPEGGVYAFLYDPLLFSHQAPLIVHASVETELLVGGSVVVTPAADDTVA